MPKIKNYVTHFWSCLDTSDPDSCWEWPGTRAVAGYGVKRMNYKLYLTHRLAYEYKNGPIPKGMYVCHKCDNPPCCNPSHLFLGWPQDNLRDAQQKGRMPKGEAHKKSKLKDNDITQIKALANSNASRAELANRFGVSRGTIVDVLYGRTWKHIQTQDTTIKNRATGSNHPFSKLTSSDVKQIRRLQKEGRSQRSIAKQFGVSRGTIEAIIKGKTWKHVT